MPAPPATGVTAPARQDAPVTAAPQQSGPSPAPGTRRSPAPLWRVPRASFWVGLPAAVWLVLSLCLTVFSAAPDAALADRLAASGSSASATAVQEEISRRGVRRTVEATFRTADGAQVTAELQGVHPHLGEYEPREGWRSTWRPGSYQYEAPLSVTYDPGRPEDVMATVDVERLVDGRQVRRGWVQNAVCVGVLGVAVLIWLLTVAVRVLRRR